MCLTSMCSVMMLRNALLASAAEGRMSLRSLAVDAAHVDAYVRAETILFMTCVLSHLVFQLSREISERLESIEAVCFCCIYATYTVALTHSTHCALFTERRPSPALRARSGVLAAAACACTATAAR